MAYGSVLASFNVEEFGTERVAAPRPRDEINERFEEFQRMTHFERAAGRARVALGSPEVAVS